MVEGGGDGRSTAIGSGFAGQTDVAGSAACGATGASPAVLGFGRRRHPARKVLRSVHEGARDLARSIARTDAYVVSRRERKKVEMLFAHLKRILRLDRLRLRGPCGARDEFHLAAAAQNLRKPAKLIPNTSPAASTA